MESESKASELKSEDDIEFLFGKHLMSDPILHGIWQLGEHHNLSIEQRLKWAVSVFCDLRNDELQRRYEETMSRPFNPYFLRQRVA